MDAAEIERLRLATIMEPLDHGECLIAFDRALELLAAQPNDPLTEYLAVLSLARAGATETALERLTSGGLAVAQDKGLRSEVAALHARLAKDFALESHLAQQRGLAADAAKRYEDAVAMGGGAYCCVNAGTMWLLAGQPQLARKRAREALDLLDREEVVSWKERYWHHVTRAEAALLLSRFDDVSAALLDAAGESLDGWGLRAVTRHQLALICSVLGCGDALLAELPVPEVIHYCGHIPDPSERTSSFDDGCEQAIAARVGDYLDSHRVGFAYGSLASGADIIIAEGLLARGADLTVVLPFALDEFVAVSVSPSGDRWVERFHACLAEAGAVVYATDGEFLDDTSLFDYCAQIAMGQAIIRASSLSSTVSQLAVWDGVSDDGVGTGSNVAAWKASGRQTTVLPWPGSRRRTARVQGSVSGRAIRAILFCDIKGFSHLTDAQMQPFLDAVMAPLGRRLDTFEEQVLHRNTWGDGLHVVLSSVSAAADCALDLQGVMRGCDLTGAGLPADLGLRIGAHVGPVFHLDDPIRGGSGFYGSQVTRTARIEPRTPEGEVYATAPFAALAVLDPERRFRCEYVGQIALAKDFGRQAMYVLKHGSLGVR